MDIKKGMKVEYQDKIYTVTDVHYEFVYHWFDHNTVEIIKENASWVQMVRKERGCKTYIYT